MRLPIRPFFGLVFCFAFCIAFSGCKEEKVEPKVQETKRTYKGDIELLNSCGMPGAAAQMKVYLRGKGFDVVSTRNDIVQNYEQTILVLRNPEWEGAQALAKALNTENVMTVISKRALVDASVYIGKDIKQIIEPGQGE
ncbi:MAG: LytR C-terminal domain-containing protein [Fibrobacter sp.]|nr:LytR C-terminal domain-containing protein [Fibrobacter sp.]